MTARDLGDDALGRALDKLAPAGAAAVFSAVAARASTVEGIRPTGMHFDTTSRSLYGAYPTADGTAGVAPRYGHAQDHRADLKQIVFTWFVHRDGVPLMGTVEDGNRSDKRLNREQIDRIVAAFRPEALQDLVSIAASALVTGPNRDAVAAAGIAGLSRLPNPFGVAATAKAAAWDAAAWIPVGRVAPRPTAAAYWASEQTGRMGDREHRLVVYRSSSRDHRKAQSLDRELAQIRADAERAAADLAAHDFACAADADAAAAAWRVQAPRWWGSQTTVHAVTLTEKRRRPGRPRREEIPPSRTVYRVQVTWDPREEAAVQTERPRRSPFVLMTT